MNVQHVKHYLEQHILVSHQNVRSIEIREGYIMSKDEHNPTMQIHTNLPIVRDKNRMYYIAKDGYVHSVERTREGRKDIYKYSRNYKIQSSEEKVHTEISDDSSQDTKHMEGL